jgi:hypothetical protein
MIRWGDVKSIKPQTTVQYVIPAHVYATIISCTGVRVRGMVEEYLISQVSYGSHHSRRNKKSPFRKVSCQKQLEIFYSRNHQEENVERDPTVEIIIWCFIADVTLTHTYLNRQPKSTGIAESSHKTSFENKLTQQLCVSEALKRRFSH